MSVHVHYGDYDAGEVEGGSTVFGIQIERKLDIANLATLIISLLTALYVGYNYLRGPQLVMGQPQTLTIWAANYEGAGTAMAVGAELLYLNKAEPGYNGAIAYEFVEFTFNGRTYRFRDHAQVSFEYRDSPPGCATYIPLGQPLYLDDGTAVFGCQAKIQPGGTANKKLLIQHPQPVEHVVPGASGASHETEFIPSRVECATDEPACTPGTRWLPWKDWMAWMAPYKAKDKETKLHFKTGLRLINGTEISKDCVITISAEAWHAFDDRASDQFDCEY